MPLTPDEIRNKQFTTTRLKQGYDEGEVDAFLDDLVAPEIERLYARVAALEAELTAAREAEPAEPSDAAVGAPAVAVPRVPPVEAASALLAMAERTASEHTAAAKAKADAVVAAAQAHAATLEREAREKHSTTMSSLDQQRAALERRVEDLRGYEREYRTRLKAYLESQLRELGSVGDAPRAAEAARPAASGGGPPAGAVAGSPQPAGGPAADQHRSVVGGAAGIPASGPIPVPGVAQPSTQHEPEHEPVGPPREA